MTNLAIIDIGTNTVLLLIVSINPDKSFKILTDECHIARLGEGLSRNNNHFLPQAMERTLSILKQYKEKIVQHHCEKTILTGTAAFRHAQNTQDFFDLLKKHHLDFEIKIISGKEEARLIHLAATKDFEHLKKPLVVLDIGGGSTELIYDNGETVSENSFAFGAVSMTEKFLKSDPPLKTEKEELALYINEQLKNLNWTLNASASLIATAGTPTTLCAIIKELTHYDPEKVHGQKMTRKELKTVSKLLADLPLKKRATIPCLPEKRADVIIAGSIILETVLDFFKLKHFHISDRGLRYGLLYNTL